MIVGGYHFMNTKSRLHLPPTASQLCHRWIPLEPRWMDVTTSPAVSPRRLCPPSLASVARCPGREMERRWRQKRTTPAHHCNLVLILGDKRIVILYLSLRS